VKFSGFFERSDIHLPLSAAELLPGEAVHGTALRNEGCGDGSVCQNVREQGFWIGAESFARLFARWRPLCIQSIK
jgi:hypothetical protein